MELVLLFLLGLCSGIIGSLVGLGGGIILVPSIIFLSHYSSWINGVTPQIAVGTSVVMMIFTGLSATLAYLKNKLVDYKSGLYFFIGSGPGAITGAWLNKYLNVHTFSIYFGIFIIIIAFILLVKDKLKPVKVDSQRLKFSRTVVDQDGNTVTYGFNPFVAIVITFVVGTLSGLFGIGGGSLMVPAMLLLFRFPMSVAIATSMFMVFLSAIVSSATHIYLGNVNWAYALAIIPGAWFGGQIGAKVNQKLKSKTVLNIFRFILILVGIQLIWEELK